jgi:proteic killer suppression protein
VEVTFRKSKFEKHTRTIGDAKREWGEVRGKRLRQRLDELEAADCLEVMRSVHAARCHELKGDLKGQLAVNLDHPYRLLFEPAHDPVPTKTDGGLDWIKVTAVRILEIVDYHD